MSIKQRTLANLRSFEFHLHDVAETYSDEKLNIAIQDLTTARNICRLGLPDKNYAVYGEIYNGMILAANQLKETEGLNLTTDVFSLYEEMLQYVINKTEKEQNFKKEILFLPYQASMWDSLESVWKAAQNDSEHCNAYVMPIPYVSLNADGSPDAWHLERDKFPEYVSMLDWTEIDLEAWHPDIIFIHNSYDNQNYITSVDSRYYSSNLKKCTDKLVYIPYFILDELCSEENVKN